MIYMHLGTQGSVHILDICLFIAISQDACGRVMCADTYASFRVYPLPLTTLSILPRLCLLWISLCMLSRYRLDCQWTSLIIADHYHKNSIRYIKSLIGTLQFETSVVRNAMVFLCRLIDLPLGVRQPQFKIGLPLVAVGIYRCAHRS